MSGDQKAFFMALQPVLSRVRRDVSAVKLSDGSRWTRDALDESVMLKHLNGGLARGACPIKEGESVTMLGLLDFDSHGGESSWAEMAEAAQRVVDASVVYGLRPVPWRSSGGRGIHLYYLWDDPQDAYSVRATLSDVLEMAGFTSGTKGVVAGQIEIFPKQDEVGQGEFGNQFILPLAGKSVPLDELFGMEPLGRDAALSLAWPTSEPVAKRDRQAVAGAGGDERDADPISRVREALFAVPNTNDDCPDYDRWRDLAFAVYEATGGSDEGLAMFDEWSAQNDKHDAKFLRERVWAYIKTQRRGKSISRATLYAAAQGHGWTGQAVADTDGFDDVPPEVVAELSSKASSDRMLVAAQKFEAKTAWKNAILAAEDEFALREGVCAKIAKDKALNNIDREMLAQVVSDRFRALGVKLPIASCRKLVAYPKDRTPKSNLPEWCDGWVFVTDADKFYRNESDEWLTMLSFNAKFNRVLPRDDDGNLTQTASWVALNDIQLPTVTREAYIPSLGATFKLDGIECVNTFRPSSVPTEDTAITPEGRRAIDLVKQHLNLITGKRADLVAVLVDWMAHNVQHPGTKIRWCPLIKGVEGDGKTLIGRVMQSVLGVVNVKNISPKVLGTDFTGWAMGACVGVLEEVKMTGHNRYDILNALKPFITNNHIPIHMKGRDEFDTMNTMNYIAFTNWADALPLSDSDRRFFVVFTPFADSDALRNALGDVAAYFDALYEAIETQRGQLRRWLLDHKISASFKPNGTAPMTDEKKSMIALSVSDDDAVMSELIEQGGIGFGSHVIATRHLTRAVRHVDPESVLQSQALSRYLVKNGWLKISKVIKWRGEAERVYVKNCKDFSNENVRKMLDETLVEKDGSLRESDAI